MRVADEKPLTQLPVCRTTASIVANQLEAEEEALAAHQRAIVAVREARRAYVNAKLPVPSRVRLFLGEAESEEKNDGGAIAPPPPPHPVPLPTDYRPNWIWLPGPKATPTTLTKAILRGMNSWVKPSDLVEMIAGITKGEVNSGSVANIGTRLTEMGVIQRQDGLWRLTSLDTAPVVEGDTLWGPKEVFDHYDLAEHRRIGIEHVLRLYDGLQITQITRLLEKAAWLQAPLSKDLVKTDLQLLAREDRAKRVGGGTKGWRAKKE